MENNQKKLYTDDVMGEFFYDNKYNWYEKEVEINGIKVDFIIDDTSYFDTAYRLVDNIDIYLDGACKYAAKELCDTANDWCHDAWLDEHDEGTEQYSDLTEHEFVSRMTLISISITDKDSFSMEFDDGDLFWGHHIAVDGNINGTYKNAGI